MLRIRTAVAWVVGALVFGLAGLSSTLGVPAASAQLLHTLPIPPTTSARPSQKTQADLDASIRQQTKGFAHSKVGGSGTLESPRPFVVQGTAGTCYTVVLHLGPGAAWGAGASNGLRFSFQSPTGPGYGGPGVVGPGAVVSLGCAKATGGITLTMAPLTGSGSIGKGPYSLEVWSHALTKQEKAHLADDEKQQDDDASKFAAGQNASKQQRLNDACSKCNARYQGCLGAARARSACDSDFRSCAFGEGGPDYTEVCANPR